MAVIYASSHSPCLFAPAAAPSSPLSGKRVSPGDEQHEGSSHRTITGGSKRDLVPRLVLGIAHERVGDKGHAAGCDALRMTRQ